MALWARTAWKSPAKEPAGGGADGGVPDEEWGLQSVASNSSLRPESVADEGSFFSACGSLDGSFDGDAEEALMESVLREAETATHDANMRHALKVIDGFFDRQQQQQQQQQQQPGLAPRVLSARQRQKAALRAETKVRQEAIRRRHRERLAQSKRNNSSPASPSAGGLAGERPSSADHLSEARTLRQRARAEAERAAAASRSEWLRASEGEETWLQQAHQLALERRQRGRPSSSIGASEINWQLGREETQAWWEDGRASSAPLVRAPASLDDGGRPPLSPQRRRSSSDSEEVLALRAQVAELTQCVRTHVARVGEGEALALSERRRADTAEAAAQLAEAEGDKWRLQAIETEQRLQAALLEMDELRASLAAAAAAAESQAALKARSPVRRGSAGSGSPPLLAPSPPRLLPVDLRGPQLSTSQVCRVRPVAEGRTAAQIELCRPAVGAGRASIAVAQGSTRKTFEFDAVLPAYANQNDVFRECSPAVQHVVDGGAALIVGVGARGSGKSFTLLGTQMHPGLAPRAAQFVLAAMRELEEQGWECAATAGAWRVSEGQAVPEDVIGGGRRVVRNTESFCALIEEVRQAFDEGDEGGDLVLSLHVRRSNAALGAVTRSTLTFVELACDPERSAMARQLPEVTRSWPPDSRSPWALATEQVSAAPAKLVLLVTLTPDEEVIADALALMEGTRAWLGGYASSSSSQLQPKRPPPSGGGGRGRPRLGTSSSSKKV